MRLIYGRRERSFVEQSMVVKKLIVFVLILMLALNAVVLLKRNQPKTDAEKTVAFKMPKIDMNDVKPGILPGLLKF